MVLGKTGLFVGSMSAGNLYALPLKGPRHLVVIAGNPEMPVGAPYNICEPDSGRYALITPLGVASGKIEVVARGVRNSVEFDCELQSGELWFTE